MKLPELAGLSELKLGVLHERARGGEENTLYARTID